VSSKISSKLFKPMHMYYGKGVIYLDYKKSGIGGIVFVGCMFLGGGLGSLFNDAHSGWLIGMGAGFLGLALTRILVK